MQDKVQREDLGHLEPFDVACDDAAEVGAHALLGDFAQQDIIGCSIGGEDGDICLVALIT